MHSARISEIADIVKDTLGGDVRIVDVKVRSDVGSDGEDIYRIFVIFEGNPTDIDTRRLSGAIRRVRPKLDEIGADAFPLFSFVSRKDRGAKALESA